MGEPTGCLFFPRQNVWKIPFKGNLRWRAANVVGLDGNVLSFGRKSQWPSCKDYSTLCEVTKMILPNEIVVVYA